MVAVFDHKTRKPRSMATFPGQAINFYICKKPGHGDNHCELNPRRVSNFTDCGNIGHEESDFLTKISSEINRVSLEIVE